MNGLSSSCDPTSVSHLVSLCLLAIAILQLLFHDVVGCYCTSGTVSLSACALAASVVTVLFTRGADLEKAELRKGAARLVLNARENIVVVMKRGDE